MHLAERYVPQSLSPCQPTNDPASHILSKRKRIQAALDGANDECLAAGFTKASIDQVGLVTWIPSTLDFTSFVQVHSLTLTLTFNTLSSQTFTLVRSSPLWSLGMHSPWG
jgi:hypothetical protein